MYAPVPHDEITTLRNYIDQQLAAIGAALLGLTEEQARATPCQSALSLAGIVKHVAYGMRGATALIIAGAAGPVIDDGAFAAYLASFVLGDRETAEGVLRDFDEARREYLSAIEGADPDADFVAPPAPWAGIHDARPAKLRYYLAHQLEEMARHAGHADIIREQIDGLAVPALVMTLEGMEANAFFQPFMPPPGSIGAANAGTR